MVKIGTPLQSSGLGEKNEWDPNPAVHSHRGYMTRIGQYPPPIKVQVPKPSMFADREGLGICI